VRQGSDGELAEAAPALAELDLSSTLVGSWHDALAIMQQLPALRQLDLSRTRLALPPQPAALPDSQTGVRLQTLVLNECHISWAQVGRKSKSLISTSSWCNQVSLRSPCLEHYKAALVLALFIAGDSPEQLHTRAEGAFPVRQSHQRIDS
jgi:hypothetical protein